MDLDLFVNEVDIRSLLADVLSSDNPRTRRLALIEIITKAMNYGTNNSGESQKVADDSTEK